MVTIEKLMKSVDAMLLSQKLVDTCVVKKDQLERELEFINEKLKIALEDLQIKASNVRMVSNLD